MDQATQMYRQIAGMKQRQLLQQLLNFGLVVASALMIWKSLIVLSGSESPIVVVLSGSMKPAFNRGDLLFLWMDDEPIRVGDITVFKLAGKDIPIVHRVLWVHEKDDGSVEFLTKGDNNPVDDRGLYTNGEVWLRREQVIGRARAYVPFVGMVTIIMNDYPQAKYLLIAVLALFVVVNRE